MNEYHPQLVENILIIDDNPNNLRLLSQLLNERGYRLRAATNGPRALASAELDPPDLILLDIRMPGMDGYEVCAQLKANPKTHDIPVIFISALDEIQDKVKAFAAGGLDYITKPFQQEEVAARVETHLALRRLQKNLQDANLRMERELALAAQVQSSFMPKKLPELAGWSIATALVPAKRTSGDFFDVLRLPNGDLGVLIADVCDKGVGAALFMAMSCALLRAYASEHPQDPGRIFEEVNRLILEYTASNLFVTVFMGIVNVQSGEMVYSNAGHNPPVWVQTVQGRQVVMLKRTGLPLGIFEDSSWGNEHIGIHPGDVLVLYTDGITDAERSRGDFFDLARLVENVREQAGCPADQIRDGLLADIRAFVDGGSVSDDMALVVLVRR